MTSVDKQDSLSLKVWLPSGTTIKAKSIASHEAHLGNLVAEGSLPEEKYFVELAEYYRKRTRRAEQEFFEFKQHLDDQIYRNSWVSRWLEQEAELRESVKGELTT